MDRKFTFCSLFLLFLHGTIAGQMFENTAGTTTNTEWAWDGTPMPFANRFAVISNTSQLNPGVPLQMQYSRFDQNGNWQLSRVYAEAGSMSRVITGRAIEHREFDAQTNVVYMAGARAYSSDTAWRAVLMVADEDGNPIGAYRHNTPQSNGDIATSIETFDAVSAPGAPASGVVVAGNISWKVSASDSNQQFFMARFSSAPALSPVWSYRYFDSQSSNLSGDYHVRKTCLGESNNQKVVAVTGYYDINDSRQLFVSCINLATGAELWRRRVQPDNSLVTTEGFDIIQDISTKNFMAVGFYRDATNRNAMYTVFFDQNGNFLKAVRYTEGGNIVARDVTYSTVNGRAVIAGFMRSATLYQRPKTFAMERFFAPDAVSPVWSLYYERSWPNILASESIERNTGVSDQPGYFITTQAFLSEAETGKFDIHIINTTSGGITGKSDPDCEVLPFTVNAQTGDAGAILPMTQASTAWVSMHVISTSVILTQEECED